MGLKSVLTGHGRASARKADAMAKIPGLERAANMVTAPTKEIGLNPTQP